MATVKVIMGGEKINVPVAEYGVLTILAALDCEAHGPMISRASKGTISVASIYKLLTRLEKRGLVQRREEYLKAGDIMAKRVLYKLSDTLQVSSLRRGDEPIHQQTTGPIGSKNGRAVQDTQEVITILAP